MSHVAIANMSRLLLLAVMLIEAASDIEVQRVSLCQHQMYVTGMPEMYVVMLHTCVLGAQAVTCILLSVLLWTRLAWHVLQAALVHSKLCKLRLGLPTKSVFRTVHQRHLCLQFQGGSANNTQYTKLRWSMDLVVV